MARILMSATLMLMLSAVVFGKPAFGAALIDLGIGLNYEHPREVETNEDFTSYASTTVSANTDVESIVYTQDEVRVKFKEEGRLLALVPLTLHPEIVAYPDGGVDVKYPWYSKITVDKRSDFENKLKSRVSIAMNRALLGVVQAEEQEHKFSPHEAALVIDAILESISTTTSPLDTSA